MIYFIYFISIFFSLCICTSSLVSTTNKVAIIDFEDPSQTWEKVEQLQQLLNKEFGEEPFIGYQRTVYYLQLLRQRIQQDPNSTSDIGKQLLASTDNLINDLEYISQKLLLFLTYQPSEQQENQTKLSQSITAEEQILLEFVSALQTSQKHLEKYTRYFAPDSQPADQQNYPPSATHPYPQYGTPPYPYGQPPVYPPYQYQQFQQEPDEKIQMLLKIGVGIGVTLLILSLLKFAGNKEMAKTYGKVSMENAKLDTRLKIHNDNIEKYEILREKFKTLKKKVKNQKVLMDTISNITEKDKELTSLAEELKKTRKALKKNTP